MTNNFQIIIFLITIFCLAEWNVLFQIKINTREYLYPGCCYFNVTDRNRKSIYDYYDI